MHFVIIFKENKYGDIEEFLKLIKSSGVREVKYKFTDDESFIINSIIFRFLKQETVLYMIK